MGSTRPFQEISTEADATVQLQIMQYIGHEAASRVMV